MGVLEERDAAIFFMQSIASLTSRHFFSPTKDAPRSAAIAAKSACGSEYLGAISIGMVMWGTFSSTARSSGSPRNWAVPSAEPRRAWSDTSSDSGVIGPGNASDRLAAVKVESRAFR